MEQVILTDRPKEPKLYIWRWIILILSGFVIAGNNAIWITFGAITPITRKYYSVSAVEVDNTAIVFFAAAVILGFPAAFIISRYGLKISAVIPAACNAVGASIRIGGLSRNQFIFIEIGQLIAGIGTIFILIISPQIAAVWFPANERTFATTCGTIFQMLGVAVGFLMSTCMVPNTDNMIETGNGIRNMLITQTVIFVLTFFMILKFFREAPPTPPSVSEYLKPGLLEDGEGFQFLNAIWDLVRNHNFVIVTIAYTFTYVIAFTCSILLSQMAKEDLPAEGPVSQVTRSGWIGFVAYLISIGSCVVVGFILDKSKRFKRIACITLTGSLISLIVFAITIHYQVNIYAVGATFILVMVFTMPHLGSGLDHIAEIGYPIPEGCSSMLVMVLSNSFAVAFTYLIQFVIDNGKKDYVAYIYCGLGGISVLLSFIAEEPSSRTVTDNIGSGVKYTVG